MSKMHLFLIKKKTKQNQINQHMKVARYFKLTHKLCNQLKLTYNLKNVLMLKYVVE